MLRKLKLEEFNYPLPEPLIQNQVLPQNGILPVIVDSDNKELTEY